MDTRFVQAHKEARWALGLTLLYLAVWLVAAYLSGVAPGFTGFPRWFEMACILTPLLFIGLCWAMVKFIYRDIPLEDDDAALSNSTAGRLSGGGVRYLGLCDA